MVKHCHRLIRKMCACACACVHVRVRVRACLCACVCPCVCASKAVLIVPGQDRLLMATPNLSSVAMTNKKQNPERAEGSVTTATARNKERAREGEKEKGE